MKFLKYIGLFAAVCVLSAIGAYLYIMNKPAEDISDQPAVYSINAIELFAEYDNNELKADDKYTGKIIAVSGQIVEKEVRSDLSINVLLREKNAFSGVNCVFHDPDPETEAVLECGQKLVIKGRCEGMLMDVVLNNCVIEQ